MSEEIKETKKKKVTKKTKKETEPNKRFIDVIEKMEVETQKVEQNNKENKRKEESKIIEEDKEKSKALKVPKNQKGELTIKSEELEKIEKEIKKQTTIPKEKMKKIYKEVFKNILMAISVLIYFILINIGYLLTKQDVFITSLKVFSITLIIITICIFEYAYKKESGKYTIHGIELLIISICTLLSIRIYTIYNNNFISSMTSISLLFAIYYVVMATAIYIKKKREAMKITNDIHEISKGK